MILPLVYLSRFFFGGIDGLFQQSQQRHFLF